MYLLILLLLMPVVAHAGQFSSTFDGSENPLSESGTWTGILYTLMPQKLNGSIVGGASDWGARYVPASGTYGDNQYSEVVFSAVSSSVLDVGGPVCRADSNGYYLINLGTNSSYILRLSPAGSVNISNFNIPPVVGHTYRVECTGGTVVTINIYDNGVLMHTMSDNSANRRETGGVGFFFQNTFYEITSWAGGDISGGGGDVTPPTTPTSLSAGATSYSISLAWGASTDNVGVQNYRVERADGACSSYVEIGTPGTTSFTDTGLSANTTYCHRVRASDGTNFSGYSNITTTTTLDVRTANLTWTDNSPNGGNPTAETGFYIERCSGLGCSNFAGLTTTAANATQYSDTASPNPIACYRVTAVPTGGGYSNTACSAPGSTPIAPSNLRFVMP